MKKELIRARAAKALYDAAFESEHLYRDFFDLVALENGDLSDNDFKYLSNIGKELSRLFKEEGEQKKIGELELKLRGWMVFLPNFIDFDIIGQTDAGDTRRIGFFADAAVLPVLCEDKRLSEEAYDAIETIVTEWCNAE